MSGITQKPHNDVTALLQQIRDAFVAELPSRLEELESLILEMKSNEAFSEHYNSVYRTVHSIKGSAGTHGLDIFTTICHAFEDEIILIEDEQARLNDENVSKWLSYIDLMRMTLNVIHNNDNDYTEIEAVLESIRGKGKDYEFEALLVIDGEIYKQMCVNAFENHHIKYSHVTTGYEALGRLLKQPYDILITNMELPDLQGSAIISAIHLSHCRNKSILSILLTSSASGGMGRVSDPDYIVRKDADMMENLNIAISNIVTRLT